MLHKVVVDGYTLPISDLSSHGVAWELNDVEDFWVIDLNEKGNKFGPDTGYYRYFLGIYQTYGTKVRILNPDVTSDVKILASDVDVDLAAPIVAFVKQVKLPNFIDFPVKTRVKVL